MSERYTIGPDADLDAEDVRDSRGNRITREYVERAVADLVDPGAPVEVVEVRRGRPSLSGGSTHSPRVSFRVPPELAEEVGAIALQQGVSVSKVAREALVKYVKAGRRARH